MKNGHADLASEAHAAAEAASSAGISQQEIAIAVGASQSQVSRILSGKSVRRSRLFDEVCIYAYDAQRRTQPHKKASATESSTLIAAMDSVWDGTETHAKALALVIRSLGALMPQAPKAKIK